MYPFCWRGDKSLEHIFLLDVFISGMRCTFVWPDIGRKTKHHERQWDPSSLETLLLFYVILIYSPTHGMHHGCLLRLRDGFRDCWLLTRCGRRLRACWLCPSDAGGPGGFHWGQAVRESISWHVFICIWSIYEGSGSRLMQTTFLRRCLRFLLRYISWKKLCCIQENLWASKNRGTFEATNKLQEIASSWFQLHEIYQNISDTLIITTILRNEL